MRLLTDKKILELCRRNRRSKNGSTVISHDLARKALSAKEAKDGTLSQAVTYTVEDVVNAFKTVGNPLNFKPKERT